MSKNNPPWAYWLQSLTESRIAGRKIVTYQQSLFSQMNELCLHFNFTIGAWHQEFFSLILPNTQRSPIPHSIHTGKGRSYGGVWETWWATSALLFHIPLPRFAVVSTTHWRQNQTGITFLISCLLGSWFVNCDDPESFKLVERIEESSCSSWDRCAHQKADFRPVSPLWVEERLSRYLTLPQLLCPVTKLRKQRHLQQLRWRFFHRIKLLMSMPRKSPSWQPDQEHSMSLLYASD